MKKYITSLFVITFILFSISCRKDFSTIPSTGTLFFSKDTVFLDTVFTNISSSTYLLKVYNRSNNDIHIPSINLGRSDSFYRLNVDGLPGSSFTNIPLLAKDSLHIFIETTIDHSKVINPIYTDSIVFDAGDKLQNVKLVTLVQDAHFIFPNDTNTETINGNLTIDGTPRKIRTLTLNDTGNDEKTPDSEWHFTNTRPYVIYGYCAVPENKTLTIDPGAKLFFHENAALIVNKDATLHINGTIDNKVHIEGDRLEPEFSQIAGQWDAIWLRAGSTNNQINHTVIKNGTIGIISDSISETSTSPTLLIKNTEIYNQSDYGLFLNESNVIGENLVVGNSRLASVTIKKGGNYNFNHATLANYWSGSIRRTSTLEISNTEVEVDANDNPIVREKKLKAIFTNCIIDGNKNDELQFSKNENDEFIFSFKNCMLKYSNTDNDPLYDFTNTSLYSDILLNGKMHFKNTDINEFQIGEENEGIDKADLTNALKTPLDIIETDRTLTPDIGAYQHITFEKEN